MIHFDTRLLVYYCVRCIVKSSIFFPCENNCTAKKNVGAHYAYNIFESIIKSNKTLSDSFFRPVYVTFVSTPRLNNRHRSNYALAMSREI